MDGDEGTGSLKKVKYIQYIPRNNHASLDKAIAELNLKQYIEKKNLI